MANELVPYLEEALRLDNLDSDPAYQFTESELNDIIEFAIQSIDPQYSLTDYPAKLRPVIILLARKEVYWRLATATAPLYPLEAEGAGLQQNVRFDHYLELIRKVDEEIDKKYGNMLESMSYPDITDNTGQIVLSDKYYTRRNYGLSEAPKANLIIDEIYADKVELSWDKFDVMTEDGMFACYNLYLSEKSILDFYADEVLQINGETVIKKHIRDIHRNKYRFPNLTTGNTYFVTLEVKNLNSRRGYSEVSFVAEAGV